VEGVTLLVSQLEEAEFALELLEDTGGWGGNGDEASSIMAQVSVTDEALLGTARVVTTR
jgi:hypothetical protein